jgi:hypothetical protein
MVRDALMPPTQSGHEGNRLPVALRHMRTSTGCQAALFPTRIFRSRKAVKGSLTPLPAVATLEGADRNRSEPNDSAEGTGKATVT